MNSFEIENGVLHKYTGEDLLVQIPEGVEFIDDCAFYGNETMVEAIFPSSVRRVGRSAFAECHHLKRVALNEGLQVLSDTAFESCFALEEIVIPDSAQYMGRMVFMKCTSLKYAKLPLGLYEIYHGMFMGDVSLEHVDVPLTVRVVEPSAFAYCKNLEELVFSDALSVVAPGAFYGCDSLKRGYIPGLNLNYYNLADQLIFSLVYLSAREKYSYWEQQCYDSFVQDHKMELAKIVLERSSLEAMEGLLGLQIMTPEEMDDWILLSRKAGALEFTARLLKAKGESGETADDMWEI